MEWVRREDKDVMMGDVNGTGDVNGMREAMGQVMSMGWK